MTQLCRKSSLNLHGTSSLHESIKVINDWPNDNLFQLNPTKCKELCISFKRERSVEVPILSKLSLQQESWVSLLGQTLDGTIILRVLQL